MVSKKTEKIAKGLIKMKRKMSLMEKQRVLFGICTDPIIFLIADLIILVGAVSMVKPISKSGIVIHTLLGFLLTFVARVVLGVYHQDWRKMPIFGLLRVGVAEAIACATHYVIQEVLHRTMERMMLIHIFAIASVDLILVLAARFVYFGYLRKKDGESKLLLASPTMHESELRYIQEAFDSNWVAPLGFNCDGFENEMVETLGGGMNAFATVSGTSAIHLAVKLAGVKRGDHVLCSDLTFAATVNPVVYEGGIPVFIDSEYETWNMSPEALERGFEKYPDAKVVVLAHLYGTPAKMDELLAVCKKHNAILVEDSAEALGATYKGKSCGTFGEYNVLSFNGNKIITTSGGGMLLTKEKAARDKALFWSTQAREGAPWYQHEELGYNYRMSNVIAGIGRGQLKHLDDHKARKTEIYDRYKAGFEGLPVQMNPYLTDSVPNFWLSCLVINPEAMCKCQRGAKETSWVHEDGKTCPDELASILRENKIETRPIWKPMHMQPFYSENDFISTGVGEDIFARGICLPSDIKMTKEAQEKVISVIRDVFGK